MKIYLFFFIYVFGFLSAFSQVGINTSNPVSTLDINGNLSVKHVALTGAGSATNINDGRVYFRKSLSNQSGVQIA